MPRKLMPVALLLVWFSMAFACTRAAPGARAWRPIESTQTVAANSQNADGPTRHSLLPATRAPGAPILTPTPDPARILPTQRVESMQYMVKPSDTLGKIAQRYGVQVTTLVAVNDIANPDLLEPGQVLTIPPAEPRAPGPDEKVIPDSELVFGPNSANFDLNTFIAGQKGYLRDYQEEINGELYTGAEVIDRVSRENSVNPRLLLAVLDYTSGWVTQTYISEKNQAYPLLLANPRYEGLYKQLGWAANNLDRGYYLWRANAVPSWVLADGAVIPASPIINAGTAGVQYFFSLLFDTANWTEAVTENGLLDTYSALFGYPFDLAVEPLIPADLAQPPMVLPFEPGNLWAFTGGPHGGWADGSGWAAIDFAPPGEPLGCVTSEWWVTAVADGVIIRAKDGAVVQDLDGDGLEQTGWTVLYMHIESQERVQPGDTIQAGERIGHPSCEGGFSTGTHLHLARRYNGEWIPADGPLPFNLDGWLSKGDGAQYNGFLIKDGVVIEAMEGVRTENQIER